MGFFVTVVAFFLGFVVMAVVAASLDTVVETEVVLGVVAIVALFVASTGESVAAAGGKTVVKTVVTVVFIAVVTFLDTES